MFLHISGASCRRLGLPHLLTAAICLPARCAKPATCTVYELIQVWLLAGVYDNLRRSGGDDPSRQNAAAESRHVFRSCRSVVFLCYLVNTRSTVCVNALFVYLLYSYGSVII